MPLYQLNQTRYIELLALILLNIFFHKSVRKRLRVLTLPIRVKAECVRWSHRLVLRLVSFHSTSVYLVTMIVFDKQIGQSDEVERRMLFRVHRCVCQIHLYDRDLHATDGGQHSQFVVHCLLFVYLFLTYLLFLKLRKTTTAADPNAYFYFNRSILTD